MSYQAESLDLLPADRGVHVDYDAFVADPGVAIEWMERELRLGLDLSQVDATTSAVQRRSAQPSDPASVPAGAPATLAKLSRGERVRQRLQGLAEITETLEAMARYQRQLRTSPHPRIPEAIETLASHCGWSFGVPAAEAFSLVHALR